MEQSGVTRGVLRNYCLRNTEQVFSLTILLTAPIINYFIPYRLIFLNSYFIIILLGTYFLETRKALLGGVLSTLLITLYAYYFPHHFREGLSELDMWMNLLAWTGFLILAAALIGTLIGQLRLQLKAKEEALRKLEQYSGEMEVLIARLASLHPDSLSAHPQNLRRHQD